MEKYNKSELETLIFGKNLSYTEIGKIYGVSGTAIKKNAKKLGINLPRRRKINPKENFSHFGKRSAKTLSKIELISNEEFISIISKCDTWKDMSKMMGYNCIMSSKGKQIVEERCLKLGIGLNIKLRKDNSVLNKTKGELFGTRKNWQSARSDIQKNARIIFNESNKECKCAICGYSNHIEIAHIKAVSEFEDSSLISEINDINNLIALCPNHHWEYDNGLLKI